MKRIFVSALAAIMLTACGPKVYRAADFGIVPGTGEDMTEEVATAIETIKSECNGSPAVLLFEGGDYDFYPDSANVREYYISNHDQDNPKKVAIVLEGVKNLTLKAEDKGKDARRADFYMNGRMLPIAMVGCENCTLDFIGIDTRVPQITQVEVIENDTENGFITYRIAPYANYKIIDGRLVVYGSNWEMTPSAGIAFDGKTRHLVYRTSDIWVGVHNVQEVEPRVIRAPWRDARLVPGTVVAMRSYARPTPGIFVSECRNVAFDAVTVYYAEGMGLLAQVSENLTLDGFQVAARSNERYFTTQADATHFSACKGTIKSVNGLYEGMMDDAINIHGTYLRVKERLDDYTLVGRYMHPQAYGFYWGGAGDSVQFVRSNVMEITEGNRVVEIAPYDKEQLAGCKEFKIKFEKALPQDIANGNYGIENLEWTPEVLFANNTIRNNRARGTLFSTPKRTVVENNFFDHTSGTAILLCGDCNGWFETGACRDVVIRNNRFVNSLTNMFQFTNGIISIYPEIPDLAAQTKYFHGGNGKGVVIENNVFETFDAPIVYAKSLDGFVFRGNKIIQNNDFEPFHWNNRRFFFEKVVNVTIENNEFDGGFDEGKDVLYKN
ncbi:MAG: right-handed parallel beta-helix repeat-containing protein [Bacteroidaceae bacterium]|nr:right-handed parallel beta-helix repeat-containing protein [Bacteroidaceae bacterium]MBP3613641.1 right-handed parallel beta-helix repeat-containing protein [Bacteroidaceae bacterium]